MVNIPGKDSKVPHFYNEALKMTDDKKWQEVRELEIELLEKLKTWDLVRPPKIEN